MSPPLLPPSSRPPPNQASESVDFITRRYQKLELTAKERIDRVNKIVDEHYEFETDYELTADWIQQLRNHIDTVKIRLGVVQCYARWL